MSAATDAPPVMPPTLTTWEPVDLAPALAGDVKRAEATILRRADGVGMLYPGKVNSLSGESESLKTWLALLAVVQELGNHNNVMFLDFEDSVGSVVGDRLCRAFGAPPDVLRDHLTYVRPELPLTVPGARDALRALVSSRHPSLIVVDGVTEAMTAHGLDIISNADVAKFFALLPRPLADLGSCVVLLDHVTKDRDQRGRFAIGAQHKLSMISGAAFVLDRVKIARIGDEGHSKVSVAKDRPSGVRPHTDGAGRFADFYFGSTDDAIARHRLVAPTGDAHQSFRPTGLMENISRVLEASTTPLSQARTVEPVSGKREWKLTALRHLETDGYVCVERAGASFLYHSIKPFREQDS